MQLVLLTVGYLFFSVILLVALALSPSMLSYKDADCFHNSYIMPTSSVAALNRLLKSVIFLTQFLMLYLAFHYYPLKYGKILSNAVPNINLYGEQISEISPIKESGEEEALLGLDEVILSENIMKKDSAGHHSPKVRKSAANTRIKKRSSSYLDE